MTSLTLKIADLKLQINFSNKKWFNFCQDKFQAFAVPKTDRPDLSISVTFLPKISLTDVRWEYRSRRLTKLFFPNSLRYFHWFNFFVKNIWAGTLLFHRGGLIHGSSVAIGSRAAVFVGKTGQGKSTVAKLLGKRILADDRSIIRFDGNIPYVYNSPFYERRFFPKRPDKFPLKGLFLLIKKKTEHVKIGRLPQPEAVFCLLPHIVIREEAPATEKLKQLSRAFELAELLTKTVRVYTLSYPLSFTGLGRIIHEAVSYRSNPPAAKKPAD